MSISELVIPMPEPTGLRFAPLLDRPSTWQVPQHHQKLKSPTRHHQAASGQALLEFLLILAMIFFLSMAMLRITNRGLATIWKAMVETVARPSTVQFR